MNHRSLALAAAGSLLFAALGRGGDAASDDEAAAAPRSRLTPVSNPATDFDFSRLGGFSQISPSVAWCGRRVVVGYEDTGSLFETAFTPEDGAGVIGVALSEDSGRTFLDLGPLPPGPPDHFLDTEPAVVCAGPGVFYLSASRLVATGPELQVGYSVSRSVDGGRTWADPVDAVLKGDLDHTPVSGRLAVDPSQPDRLYLAYADLMRSDECRGPRTTTELVRSVDGGATWSAPIVVDDACGPAGDVDVAVGPHGEVYVAWEAIHPDALEVKARRSLDGKSFGPTGSTGRFLCAGDCRQRLQGHIGQGARFALAVDRSRGATRGSAYLAWTIGRNAGFPDPLSFSGVYGFADVVTSRSIDGGVTWSAPLPAHPADPAGAPTDQFQPALAVDAAGRLALCFYDRGRDPLNVLVDYTCALSGDAGRTWAHERVTPSGFAFLRGTDEILSSTVEIGHRTGVAADAMGRQAGFLSAFVVQDRRGNPDVKAARLR